MRLSDAEYSALRDEIKEWILRIDEDEIVPKSLKALNFGLVEPYGIELTGSRFYNAEDDDWVFQEDFVPDERQCPNIDFSENMGWEYFRNTVLRILKDLDKELRHETELLKVPHITTGFTESGILLVR